jgi:CBS domain containing-hemolysin-like protein
VITVILISILFLIMLYLVCSIAEQAMVTRMEQEIQLKYIKTITVRLVELEDKMREEKSGRQR